MERGETTAQVVLAVPVLLLFLLFGIQVSLYFHTAQIASIAAQEAAIAGAAAGSNEIEAIAVAVRSVAELHASEGKTPIVRMGERTIEVEVLLRVPAVISLFPAFVTRSASEPLERYVYEVER
jgi:hypothetical protein